MLSGLDWSAAPNVTLRLRDSPISTDATLSGLAVNDGSTDVTLTPTFASGTTSYTASVANAVAELTLTPTTTDDGAAIKYLNASDMTLADAGTAAGQQVVLAVGATVIKVKVTAEDGTTTRTYTVTATRAPTCTPDTAAGDIWCVVVTVGALKTSGSTTGYGFSSSVGHLSDTGFRVGTNPYTVDLISVGAAGTSGAGSLFFSLTSDLAAADAAKLVLHVDSAEFAFSDAFGPSGTNTYSWVLSGLDWSSVPNVTLRLRDGSTPDATDATDATLSALVVNDGSTDLTLSPGFASDKYTYTVSVGNTVAEVTVTPTENDSSATIEYLDASDMTLDDALTAVTGHQVAVAVGATVFKVKVTASDGTTTQTYAVTVNRASATAPGKPTGLTATASGSTQIDLSWTAPRLDGGSAITGYRIEVSTDGSTWTDLVADTGSTDTSYSHTGLAGGDTRHYRVSAINAAGTSAPSDAVSTNTDAATAPGKPTGLTATASGSTQIDLTWTAPASDGGSAITGYRIEVSTDGSTWTDRVADTDSTDTSYSHTGLEADDTRHYRVSAINAAGTSEPSDAVSTNTAPTAPGKPTGLTATASGSTQIDLTWTPPASDGGSAITGYRIEVSTDGSTWTDLVADTGNDGTSYSHTGLEADDTRHYRVSAINAAGTSDPSDAVSTNTETTTTTPTIASVAVTSTPLLTSSGGSTPDTYGAGEDIEFTVIFSAAVEVTGDPQFGFSLAGPSVADLDSGISTTTALVFVYTVQPTDQDDDGIWVGNHASGNQTLQLDADDAIASLGGTAANLEHGILGRLDDHKVDGSRTVDDPVVPIPPGLEVTLQLSDDGDLENASPVTVTATVSPASPGAFTVTISATPVAPATDEDFELSANRVLRFAANATESTGTVTIRTVDDEIAEPTDVVRVSGAVSNAAITDPDDVTLTIFNDDSEAFDLAVSAPAAVDEDAGAAVVTVTLTTLKNTAPVADIGMFYRVERGGTATRGADYTPPPGDAGGSDVHYATVRPPAFSPNDAGTAWVAAPSFTIGIVDDSLDEADETIVFAVLTYDDQSPAHTITIRDNDATPAVSIAADTPTVVEEQSAAFTLTRTGATGSPLTVTVAVSEQADRDLLPDGAATERTVRVGAGAATTALTVALENDRVAEPDGDLTVAVQAGAGYTPGDPSSATVTVEDGDTDTAPPTVTSVVVASTPHSGDTYRWGETIVFTVTFSEPVRVMGRPWLDVGLDNPAGASGSTVRAGFWGLSDDEDVTSDSWPAPVSRHVHFGYSVQPYDIDDDGVSLGANALQLASGDRIQSDETDTYAEFAHAALAPRGGHLVDGRTTVDGEPTVPVVEAGIRFVDTDGNPLELLANGTHRLSVPEGGEARYGLRLKTRPAHKVVVSHHYHTYGGDSDLTVPRNFSFDGSIRPDTWDTQTAWVKVAAAQDDDAEDGERVFDNRAFSRDPNYHDLMLPDVVVVEADDDKEGSSHGGEAAPLTAVFEGLPEAHDGAITVTPDTRAALSISLALAAECAADGAVCTADGRALSIGAAHLVGGPGPDTGPAPLTATFPESVYASAQHTGPSDRPQVVAAFSAPVAAFGADTPSVSATGASVDGVQRLDKEGLEHAYVFFLTPEGHQAIVFRLHANRACTDGGICTADRRRLSNSSAATVAGPADEPEPNTAAAGAPTINGTPQVGEALTASTSDISDADGLDDARFAYQWIRAGADIGGATDAVAAAPEPLTASFEGLPAEHRGQGSFSFRVAFSEGISISYKTVRDASFTVTGGEVTQASRVDGRRDLWKITIAPDADEAVTVRLPETTDCAAVTVDYATADGSAHAGDDYTAASGTLRFAAGERSKTIEVGVLDDAHDEGEETLRLRLSNASGGRLADGEATGTIENHDPMPKALLARFGRTAAVHVVEHVEERLAAPREPGFRGRFAGRELRRGMERDIALNVLRQLGGAAGAGPMGAGAGGPLSGAPATGTAPFGMPGPAGGGGHPAAASGPMGMAAGPMGGATGPDGRFDGGGLLRMGLGGGDVLTGSDFALGRETGHGGILSFWSRGAQSRFSGREGALSLGGDVRTTMVGADYAKGPVVTGLSLSRSRGLGEYAGVAGGQVASSVTGLYPWLGYKATDRVTVWGVAGYGAGGLRLTPEGGPALESGLSMAMAAAGTLGELISGGAGGFALAFKADALWVGTSIDGVDGPAGRLKATEAAVTRFRTGLEGSRAYTLAGRLSLKPSVEVGLRHDGGDAETGAGMDVGLGLVVSDSSTGLAVDVRVRTLLVHQAEGFSERGVAVSLSYNPRPSTPLGFVARVAPSWGGQATSGAEALWGRQTMAGMAPGGVASGNRLDGEVGYGLPLGSRFVGTPRVGFSTSEYGRDYRVGYGLGVLNRESLNFELGVDAQRRESPLPGGTDHGALARATLGW